jgi:hypothetical protein
MKTWCPYAAPWPHGKQRSSHHVGRSRGTIWQGKVIHPGCISRAGPPRGSTGPLYAQPGPPIVAHDSRVSMPGPLDGVQIPPSKVRTTTRSRDGGNTGMSRGPVLTRVRALYRALALPAQVETRHYYVACCP